MKDPDVLAEKLDKYADLLVGFAIVETLSFWAGLANKDFREFLVAMGFGNIFAINLVTVIAICLLLHQCFKGQDELLSSSPKPSPEVKKWTERTRKGKYLLVVSILECQIIALHIMLKDLKMPLRP